MNRVTMHIDFCLLWCHRLCGKALLRASCCPLQRINIKAFAVSSRCSDPAQFRMDEMKTISAGKKVDQL